MLDTAGVATSFADEMKTHHGKLRGKAADAQAAQHALQQAAHAVTEQHDVQHKAAHSLLNAWQSKAAPSFEKDSDKFGKELTVTAGASRKGARVVGEVTDALAGRHQATGKLIDEFVAKARKLIDAGYLLARNGSPAALLLAIGDVADLAGKYLKESSGHLKNARAEMEEAARKLRALQKELAHDGVADKGGAHTKPGHHEKHEKHQKHAKHEKHHGTKPSHSKKVDKILDHARSNLGYHEGPNNRNKWGPTGQPWCSYFATSMWRKSGVDIPKYGFTGDVYKWGERHHLAYGRGAIAHQAKAGDAILFGTGPSYGGSTHIGIIEKVDGHKITTIEGNASDRVERNTYVLPRDAHRFYGGVHPK
ncbi:CHAP domain-containing protein [Amycolatopsis jiangsuensis]|uniref:FtsZ-binding cell division protein ZapB n=1 Tax=Amycolatopsis jiangsuensis TaxID=1181879 RepID=A0A840IU48_9PSEU|nr:CHAP domain-containing protein [Amycolatopsis jiangsuensis]MBB4684504.1 FtsZ-binding cell division protein ZapB [Amycolatopsis jiangsuensis]